MKKFLKRKIVVEKTVGKILFDYIGAFVGFAVGILVVLSLDFFSADLYGLFGIIESGKLSAFQFFLWFLLPISLIFGIAFAFANICFYSKPESKTKAKSKK